MDIAQTISRNKIIIRLTDERWRHIVLMHPNLVHKQKQILATVKNPGYIFQGNVRELLATVQLSKVRYLVVVYKEVVDDGFIITAFETTDTYWLFKKKLIWSKHL